MKSARKKTSLARKRKVVDQGSTIRWVSLGNLWKGYVHDRYTYQIVRYTVEPKKIVLYHEGAESSDSLGSFKTVPAAKAAADRHAASQLIGWSQD